VDLPDMLTFGSGCSQATPPILGATVIVPADLRGHWSATLVAAGFQVVHRQQLTGLLPKAVAAKVTERAGIDRMAALLTAVSTVRRGGTVSRHDRGPATFVAHPRGAGLHWQRGPSLIDQALRGQASTSALRDDGHPTDLVRVVAVSRARRLRVVEHRRHDRLWRLVSERAGQRSFSGWVGVVCEVAVEQLTVDGAATAIRTARRNQELVGFTDAWVQRLEELQYTVGDGPAVEAYDSGGPVLVSDLAATGHRWPGFAEVADVGAAFAFPLQAGAIRLGTMVLYRRRAGRLPQDEVAEAAVLADLAIWALLADASDGATEVAPWAREGSPGHYDDVNVATGMLAAELRISVQDAFLRLRAHAFSHDQPLLDVARRVLGRELRADAFRD
jgi:hypothetical protein